MALEPMESHFQSILCFLQLYVDDLMILVKNHLKGVKTFQVEQFFELFMYLYFMTHEKVFLYLCIDS